jgi:hypothetical protein
MTHKEIYDMAKKLAKLHKDTCDMLADFELEKYGFEFAETDSDRIIDTINYGIDDYDFKDYDKEMRHYKKACVLARSR